MKSELGIVLFTYFLYLIFKNLHIFRHIGYTVLAFVVLRFFPDQCTHLIQMTLAWHIFELIDAFTVPVKYDEEYKCTSTASISKSERTDDKVPEPSLSEKDSTTSNFSPRPTDESTPPEDSS